MSTAGKGFGAFALAQEVIQAIRSIVKEEMARERPNPRYARVQDIDPVDRSCIVSFIGEGDNPVRVPYGSVAPAEVGQEVRIGGIASDRRIEDIRGVSDTESRVMTLEEKIVERQFAMVHSRLAVTEFAVGAGVVKLPFTTTPQAPTSIATDSTGGWTVPVDGYYDIDSKVGLVGDNGTTESKIWLHVHPLAGVDYDLDYDTFYHLSGSGNAVGRFSLRVGALWYLNQGDTVYVNAWQEETRSSFQDASYLKMRLVAAIPQTEFPT